MKARALYAWRRPDAQREAALNEVVLAPNNGGRPEPRQAPSRSSVLSTQLSSSSLGFGDYEQVLIEDVDDNASPEPVANLAADVVSDAVPASKRPRLQVPASSPSSSPVEASVPSASSAPINGTRRPPATAPPMPPAPAPPQPPRHEPPKELRCTCGATEPISAVARNSFVVCRVCNFALHTACVEGALGGLALPEDYVCPPCRLERVDEFHPTVGAGVLRHSYASSSSTFSLTFNAQPALWRKQQWAVHLRAVQLNSPELSGPGWPHRVQGKLNGRQVVDIAPPKHLHIRREQCYNLTPLLRQGPNTLEMKFTPKPDAAEEESYCVGVVLTRPRAVQAIIQRIRAQSKETVSSGRTRVHRILAQVAVNEAKSDECKVTGNFGRVMKPVCPVSHCPIEDAAIGRACNHVQVFDLSAYIAVNQRMRALDKRWTCPVCSLHLRPDDVVLDPFAQGILDTVRGTEDTVDSIVFNEDCTWNTVSAEKDAGDDDEGGGGVAPRPSAELINLSDSE